MSEPRLTACARPALRITADARQTRNECAQTPTNTHTHTHTQTETDTQFSPFLQPQIRAVISEMRLPVATLKQLLEGSSIQATPPFPTLGSSRVPICSFQRCPWRSGFLLRGPRAQRLLRLLTLIPGLELGMQKQATPYTSSKRLSLRCFFRQRASVHVAIGPKAERRIFPTESCLHPAQSLQQPLWDACSKQGQHLCRLQEISALPRLCLSSVGVQLIGDETRNPKP